MKNKKKKSRYYECEHCGELVHEDEAQYIVDDNDVVQHIYCSERCVAEGYFGEYDEDDDWEDEDEF
jgi:formylmethanofuran dehydrogenase subunit E